jgi:hypothetical protein
MATDFENPDEEIEFDIENGSEEAEEVETEDNVEEAADDEAAEGEAEPEPEPEAAEESPAPRRNRAKERIAELARRAAEAEQRAAAYERQVYEYEQRLSASNVAQVEQAEVALKSELAIAKKELIEAKSLGDYEKEVDATERMAKLQADLSTVQNYKANVARQVQQTPQQAPQQAPQARVEPRTAAWVEQNTWFNPQSADYDPDMAIDTQAFARKLEIRLQREGRANEVGSAEYFDVIDEYVRQNYPDAFDDAPAQPTRRMPAMKASRDVAPVGRQSAPMQSKPKAGNKVRLSGEQREMAERMRPDLPPQKAWAEYARYM